MHEKKLLFLVKVTAGGIYHCEDIEAKQLFVLEDLLLLCFNY
jgi:preprotein translocase subunit SecB